MSVRATLHSYITHDLSALRPLIKREGLDVAREAIGNPQRRDVQIHLYADGGFIKTKGRPKEFRAALHLISQQAEASGLSTFGNDSISLAILSNARR